MDSQNAHESSYQVWEGDTGQVACTTTHSHIHTHTFTDHEGRLLLIWRELLCRCLHWQNTSFPSNGAKQFPAQLPVEREQGRKKWTEAHVSIEPLTAQLIDGKDGMSGGYINITLARRNDTSVGHCSKKRQQSDCSCSHGCHGVISLKTTAAITVSIAII